MRKTDTHTTPTRLTVDSQERDVVIEWHWDWFDVPHIIAIWDNQHNVTHLVDRLNMMIARKRMLDASITMPNEKLVAPLYQKVNRKFPML